MSPTTTYPIRYFSIVTVPKEFTHQMGQIENTALSGGASLNHDEIVKAISTGKSQLSSLTPYLFVLFEIEKAALTGPTSTSPVSCRRSISPMERPVRSKPRRSPSPMADICMS